MDIILALGLYYCGAVYDAAKDMWNFPCGLAATGRYVRESRPLRRGEWVILHEVHALHHAEGHRRGPWKLWQAQGVDSRGTYIECAWCHCKEKQDV